MLLQVGSSKVIEVYAKLQILLSFYGDVSTMHMLAVIPDLIPLLAPGQRGVNKGILSPRIHTQRGKYRELENHRKKRKLRLCGDVTARPGETRSVARCIVCVGVYSEGRWVEYALLGKWKLKQKATPISIDIPSNTYILTPRLTDPANIFEMGVVLFIFDRYTSLDINGRKSQPCKPEICVVFIIRCPKAWELLLLFNEEKIRSLPFLWKKKKH